ncbi:hypothetical protein [Aquimarina longa]|nr:hypothetical protein [Aquimarina longa]
MTQAEEKTPMRAVLLSPPNMLFRSIYVVLYSSNPAAMVSNM